MKWWLTQEFSRLKTLARSGKRCGVCHLNRAAGLGDCWGLRQFLHTSHSNLSDFHLRAAQWPSIFPHCLYHRAKYRLVKSVPSDKSPLIVCPFLYLCDFSKWCSCLLWFSFVAFYLGLLILFKPADLKKSFVFVQDIGRRLYFVVWACVWMGL